MAKVDIILVTDSRYENPIVQDDYTQNILLEDRILNEAFARFGLRTRRVAWDNTGFNWAECRIALLRTTWDYFYRVEAFQAWLQRVSSATQLVNDAALVEWNIAKTYLLSLKEKGISIPPTLLIEQANNRHLSEIVQEAGWEEVVLKPVVSGAGRHTYRLHHREVPAFETTFKELIRSEDFLLQEFQASMLHKGEIALMFADGHYTHAVLKKARKGEFRVQDDFGGQVFSYSPSAEEIVFAREVMEQLPVSPPYARVDIFRDKEDNLMLSELELIEPEMWFRFCKRAAGQLAACLYRDYFA